MWSFRLRVTLWPGSRFVAWGLLSKNFYECIKILLLIIKHQRALANYIPKKFRIRISRTKLSAILTVPEPNDWVWGWGGDVGSVKRRNNDLAATSCIQIRGWARPLPRRSLHHALTFDLRLQFVHLRFDGVFQFWKMMKLLLLFRNKSNLKLIHIKNVCLLD